jgi:DNA-binding response OmpR family regulator
MDEFEPFHPTFTPTARRPLLGLTVLVVEDSRFASEALRLICLRGGARIRRADSLKAARRHLRVFRPSVVIIDLGLPDGSGIELIRELCRMTPPVAALLATSGDDHLAGAAQMAGADAFLAKPILSVEQVHSAILAHLPADMRPHLLRNTSSDVVVPDQLAYQDDMAHAADLLDGGMKDGTLAYVLQFLASVAQSANDQKLMSGVSELQARRHQKAPIDTSLAHLAAQVQRRLTSRAAI